MSDAAVQVAWPESWAISRDLGDRETWHVYTVNGKPPDWLVCHVMTMRWDDLVDLFGIKVCGAWQDHFSSIDRQSADRARRLVWPHEWMK